MKALYFEKFGERDVLRYGELPKPTVKSDEVLVRTVFIGLNFADIYRRRGTYPIEPHEPFINGYEASGEIIEAENAELIGRRVLFVDVPLANAELVAVPLEKLIFLSDEISLKTAASVGLQGLTADFLVHDLAKNLEGQKAFVTGISGGVGQILAQMLIADGVEVYGSASPAKAQVALDFGAKRVFSSRENHWLSDWKNQFDTVYDGIGTTLNQSISLLKNRGQVVFFRMAAGNPPQVDFIDLLAHSKSILTGDLWDYLTSFAERKSHFERLSNYLISGKIKLTQAKIFSLSKGKAAHDFLESGKNIGKVLLRPES